MNRANWALQFNGAAITHHGDVHDIATSSTDKFTVEAWIKANVGYDVASAQIFGKRKEQGGQYRGWDFTFGTYTGGGFEAKLGFAYSDNDGTYRQLYANQTFTWTDKWYHVVYRFDGTNEEFFVDGVKYTASTRAGSKARFDTSNAREFSIGGRSYGTNTVYTKISVAEARIWNDARTDAEILGNMHKRLLGDETYLEGYYTFDEGTGTTITNRCLNAGGANGAVGGTGQAWVDGAPISGTGSVQII